MTDSEVAALRPDQVLVDEGRREWRVLGHLSDDAGLHWVMVRRGDQVIRLSYRNSAGG